MSRTRVKANFGDIWQLGNGCYDSYRIKRNDGFKGELFKFNKLSNSDIEFINQWKNTEIVIVQCQYAPEIKKRAVILYDKCIR